MGVLATKVANCFRIPAFVPSFASLPDWCASQCTKPYNTHHQQDDVPGKKSEGGYKTPIWEPQWHCCMNLREHKNLKSHGSHQWNRGGSFWIQWTQDQHSTLRQQMQQLWEKTMGVRPIMVACGKLTSLHHPELLGMDKTGLAHWLYVTFSNEDNHLITTLVGYNPCCTSLSQISSSYQIHIGYFTVAEQDIACLHCWFETDWVTFLK